MGDFEAPSFSLGFDFDFDDTPEPQTTPNNTSNRDSVAADVKSVVDSNDNDKEFVIETLTVADSDEENEVSPRLKLLRRGCSVEDRGLSGSATVDLGSVVVDDDDIEVFSSPEDNNAKESRGSELPSTSTIDFMGQFSSGDKTKQATRKSKAHETSQGSMNPKVKTAKGIAKDAGKRRAQADGQGTGHWFTNGDGKRVYVAINGQEMIGKAAYIHYKKESGGGFKNKKAKKTSTKKK